MEHRHFGVPLGRPKFNVRLASDKLQTNCQVIARFITNSIFNIEFIAFHTGGKMAKKNMIFLMLVASFSTCSFAQYSNLPNTTQIYHETKEAALKASGLDVYASKKNDDIINAAAKNIEQIKTALASSYAGTWIKYDENNVAHQVVAIKGGGNLTKISNAPENGFLIADAKYSYQELHAIREKILTLFKNLANGGELLIFGVAIDEENNKLIVRGYPQDLNFIRSKIVSSGIEADVILLEAQDGPMTLMGVLFGAQK